VKKLTCIIIEDEKPAQRILESYVHQSGFFSLGGVFDHVVDAMQYLKEHTPDLLILDIHMPGINGLEFARSFQSKSAIIFTTAYSEHAVEGFDMGVTDYLLKPFSFERFLTAIQRFLDRRRMVISDDFHASSAKEETSLLIIKTTKGNIKVPIDDIDYLQSYGNYLKVFTVNNTFVVRQTMTQMLMQLPADKFIRIHRSFAVQLNRIVTISSGNLTVGTNKLPIGSVYYDTLLSTWRKGAHNIQGG